MGQDTITVKLALWSLHIGTKKDLSVREDYPAQGQPLLSPARALPPLPSAVQSTKKTGGNGKGPGKRGL